MKILRWLCCLVMLICAAESLAAKKIATLITPMAYSGYVTQVHYYLEILTPEGVAYGVYKQHSIMLKAENLDLVSWTGSNTAPTLKAESVQLISIQLALGLMSTIRRQRHLIGTVRILRLACTMMGLWTVAHG